MLEFVDAAGKQMGKLSFFNALTSILVYGALRHCNVSNA